MDDDDGFEYTTSSHKKATATGSGLLTSTKPKAQRSLPTINDEDDEETYLRPKTHPKKNLKGQKTLKLKAKPPVKSFNNSNSQFEVIKKTASRDSEIEEIGARTESPEEELGELSTMAMLTILWLLTISISEERMAKEWTSPIYGFFKPRPTIEVVEGCRCHEFLCAAPLCQGKGVRPRIVR